MPVSQQIIFLLQYLLPGFLAAWVFYGLTSHAKPSHFERVIQALIFVLFIQAFVYIGGKFFPGHDWVMELLPFLVAVVMGIVFTVFVNNDWLHKLLRKTRFTKRTAYESEWRQSFESYDVSYVVLHLRDQRRLIGWPEIWPDNPDNGHLLLADAAWIQGDGGKDADIIELDGVRGILVDASHIHMIEFIGNHPEESS